MRLVSNGLAAVLAIVLLGVAALIASVMPESVIAVIRTLDERQKLFLATFLLFMLIATGVVLVLEAIVAHVGMVLLRDVDAKQKKQLTALTAELFEQHEQLIEVTAELYERDAQLAKLQAKLDKTRCLVG